MITVDTSVFNRRIALFTDKLGINAATVVRKEAGELMKTLVAISPPSDYGETKSRIDKQIRSKFEESGDFGLYWKRGGGFDPEKPWYFASKNYLFGVGPENDKRNAGTDELYKLALSLTQHGSERMDFKHPRKQQRVLMTRKILVKKGQLTALVKRIQGHVGRLKAGWLLGSDVVGMSGSNMPAQWVTKHKLGAKGRYVDGLGVKDFPTFAIGNSSAGIHQNKMHWWVQRASDIRSKAMLANFRLFFSGKKELSQYA